MPTEEFFLFREGVQMLHCMAQAGRYFKEAEDNDKTRSGYALLAFQELYDLERQLKDLPLDEKYKLRQEAAAPKLEELYKWMIEQYSSVTPKSLIGKALESP